MKIIFLSHASINIALFRLDLIRHLMGLGHEVFVLVPEDEHTKSLRDENLDVRTYSMSRRSLNPFREIFTIFSLYKVAKGLEADLLHSFTLKPNVYGLIVAKFLHIKSIQTITGLGSFYISNSFTAKFVRLITQSIYKMFRSSSSGIIFQNPDDMQYFIDKKLCLSQKAHLIMGSGIDTKAYSPQGLDDEVEELRKRLKLSDKRIVLMVARAIEHKGVKEFYALAKRLYHKYHFIYVGGIDKENPSAMSEEFMHTKEVYYEGEQTNTKPYYALCDLFVLPSYKEGLPRTILEAMSFSKPVVAARASGSKELIKDGYNGFLARIGSVDELEEFCEKILSDDELMASMARHSFEICEEKFSIDIIVKEYERVYECIKT